MNGIWVGAVCAALVCGYIVLFNMVRKRVGQCRSVSTVAVSVLVVYLCAVGAIAALGQALGGVGLLLYACAIVYSMGFAVYMVVNRARRARALQPGPTLAFAAFSLAVLYFTLFSRSARQSVEIQMHVFAFIDKAVQKQSFEPVQHMLENVVLFVPLGVLFPMMASEQPKKGWMAASWGLAQSTLIETVQLLGRLGICDIDDIGTNALGAALGFALYQVAVRELRRSEGASPQQPHA